MKIAKNIKAISRLLFILLLLLALIIGAIFSYLLVIGYYLNLGVKVPENTTLSVMSVIFDPQDAETFNLTVLNPTYSPTEAKITEIIVATEDDTIHKISNVNPQLPFELPKGQEESFICNWNWEDYSGETVKVIVLVEEGSGSAYEVNVSPVSLTLTTMGFNPADTEHFNMTLRNAKESTVDLNFNKIVVTTDDGTEFEVTDTVPKLPQVLYRNSHSTFKVSWDWTDYRGRNVTVTAYTSEGYTAYRTQSTPQPVLLSIADIAADASDTTSFNVTVSNSELSVLSANLASIKVNLADETTVEVDVESPTLPYALPVGETVTLKCLWDWTDRQGENIIVVAETSEGYIALSEILQIG